VKFCEVVNLSLNEFQLNCLFQCWWSRRRWNVL